ncbi:MAG: sel1 repeat family protein [Nisaea sp.]|uniref:tetratricopeptide repeat protein n=1 Tax=Nisaea sp. TaxID=2024842 RepID=UPI001B0239D9|nr:tetratricopeptide repeat protein [Nisaea sp.]MBO6561161.1 sel1 repeat family protein [Nisaea sp.]
MRVFFSVSTIALALAFLAQVVAQDFDRGRQAYDRGDYPTALREWQPLAEQGDRDAQFSLGRMHENGKGVPQSDTEAINWYRKAAEQGHEQAQFNLGGIYRFSQGVPRDYAEAAHWYLKAAEQGNEGAQIMLGSMYYSGRGVPQDEVLAYMWYSLAAEQGSSLAFEGRDFVAGKMTTYALRKAERLYRDCLNRGYKGCGK